MSGLSEGPRFDGHRAVDAVARHLQEELDGLLRKRSERFDYIQGPEREGHPGGAIALDGIPFTYLDAEICRLTRALEALLR